MIRIETEPTTLIDIDIHVELSELLKQIRTGAEKPDITAAAKETLKKVSSIWNPVIVYSWYPYGKCRNGENDHFIYSKDNQVKLNLGHSAQFIDKASYVLVAAYSVGKEIEEAGQEEANNRQHLAAYIIDLIGLLVLEKTGDIVKQIAERKAKDFGWGVSPFLSPGSIHGWELEEQLQLCSLLPLDKVGLAIQSDAVLRPFKSLSCLIGIGPEFDSTSVGSTCQVCSKNVDCQMKQI